MPEADKTIDEGKIFAFLGYWGILFLVPLLGKKENKFAVFHGKQGLVLFIFEVILIILGVLTAIPYIGILFFLITIVGWLFAVIMAIIGMIKSLQGDYWKMPILGDIAEKINI